MSELTANLSAVIQKHDEYLTGRIDFEYFYSKFLLQFLITSKNYKNEIGERTFDSLALHLINIKDKFDAYKQQDQIGNEDEKRKEMRYAMLIANKIVNELKDIEERLTAKNSDKIAITKNNMEILEDEEHDLRLDDKDWKVILDSIRKKECIPFLGAEPLSPWISLDVKVHDQWTKNLSQQWAEEYGYPFQDSNQLSSVTQFMAIDNGDPTYPKTELSNILKRTDPPDFSEEKYNDTPYAVLADIELPIYITTNYDHFMEKAIESRNRNGDKKFAQTEVCRWNDDVQKYLRLMGKESLFYKKKSTYKPNIVSPLVYHLHGDVDIPESMVLTERDYIDFIRNLSIEGEKGIIPASVRMALAKSSLLFIGYDLEEINFRIIFQCILGLQVGDLRKIGIAVQLRPRFTYDKEKKDDKEKKALKYLKEYAKGMKVRVYWGNSFEFCRELRQKLNGN